MPEFAHLHAERLKPGVTLQLLHIEYLERNPGGYAYTRFCELYRAWADKRRVSMRQEHKAGEKLFVDYSGKKAHFVDPKTGERVEVELFVAVLGASNYTYAEATLTQQGRTGSQATCALWRSWAARPPRWSPTSSRAA
jgi:transposase